MQNNVFAELPVVGNKNPLRASKPEYFPSLSKSSNANSLLEAYIPFSAFFLRFLFSILIFHYEFPV
jgi:hypothetical protein